MSAHLANVMVRIRQALVPVDEGTLSDCVPLRSFVATRDEAAFAVLVRRHTDMIFRVCRAIVRDEHVAEDAVQAVWLVFLRKAGSIKSGQDIGPWLHKVAVRIAIAAREETLRRRRREMNMTTDPVQPAAASDELVAALQMEVGRLPEQYRQAIVLCYLEGRSGEEAARRLGKSPPTFSKLLTKGRELLGRRLARQGFAVAAVAVPSLLAPSAGAAQIGLVQRILALGVAPGTGTLAAKASAPAAWALANRFAMEVFWTKVRWALLGTLMLTAAGSGAFVFSSAATPDVPRQTRDKIDASKTKTVFAIPAWAAAAVPGKEVHGLQMVLQVRPGNQPHLNWKVDLSKGFPGNSAKIEQLNKNLWTIVMDRSGKPLGMYRHRQVAGPNGKALAAPVADTLTGQNTSWFDLADSPSPDSPAKLPSGKYRVRFVAQYPASAEEPAWSIASNEEAIHITFPPAAPPPGKSDKKSPSPRVP